MLEASPTFLAGRIGRYGRNAFIMGQRPQSVLGLFTGSMYTLVVGMIPLNNKLVRPAQYVGIPPANLSGYTDRIFPSSCVSSVRVDPAVRAAASATGTDAFLILSIKWYSPRNDTMKAKHRVFIEC